MLVSEAKVKGKKGREGVLDVLDRARAEERLSEATLKGAATYAHDPVHFSKITASLMPVLAMLTSGALRQTLSPRDDDPLAMSLSEIIAQRKILYVCLNSLPDPTVAGAIGFDASCRPRLLRGRTLQQHVHLPKHCQSLRRRVFKHD